MNNFSLFKKIIASICLSSVLLAGPTSIYAGTWGEAMAAEIASQAWKLIYDTIKEMIIAKIKSEIAKRVDKVLRKIGLSGEFGEIIGVFYDEIFGGVLEAGNKVIDDYFKDRLKGAPPLTQDEKDKIDKVFGAARQVMKETVDAYARDSVGLMQKVAGPSAGWNNVFSGEGGAKAIIANAFDNPYIMHSNAVNAALEETEKQKEAFITQAIATGGWKDGKTPGSGNVANAAIVEDLLNAGKKLVREGGLSAVDIANILSALTSMAKPVDVGEYGSVGVSVNDDGTFDINAVLNTEAIASKGASSVARNNRQAEKFLKDFIKGSVPENVSISELAEQYQKDQAGIPVD